MRLALIIALLCCSAFASKKPQLQDSDWNTGMLLEQTSDRECDTHGARGVVRTDCTIITRYRVNGVDLIYVFSRGGRVLNVTTNAPLRYAIKDRDAFIIDEDGKQQKLRIVEKIKKPGESK